jgi:autotransporter-associated beta strand protein
VSTGGGLTKAGLNTLTLTWAATYSGNTTVAEGTLSLEAANPNNESSTVTLASIGSQLQLNYAGTDTVARLVTGTTQRVAGTYGHTDSGATNGGLGVGAMDAWFAPGTGILTVTFNPVAGGYGTWASANAPTGTPADDFDRDGVPNGVEYVLGGDRNTNDAGKLPQISSNGGNMVFTFQRSQASIDGSTTVVIETGTGLGTWPDTYPVPATALVNNPGVTVVKNSPAGFDTVTLAVPQAPDAIKFARLKVTVVP